MAVISGRYGAPRTSPTFNTSILGSFGGTSLFKAGATSNYNVVSLNNDITLAGVNGIFGGATGDADKLYLAAVNAVALRVNNTDVCLTTGAVHSPAANDGCALGSTSLKWSDVFLASGAVINFNSGNFTLTHSAGLLTFAGGPIFLGGGISGVTDGSSASAGAVGERLDGTGTLGSVSLTSGVAANVTSVSLTAGDWEIDGIVYFLPGATTNVTGLFASIGTTSATVNQTIPVFAGISYPGTVLGQNNYTSLVIPPSRISVSSTTTYFLVAHTAFTVSTMTVGGRLHATRIR